MGKTARDIMTGNVIVVEDDMSINNLAGGLEISSETDLKVNDIMTPNPITVGENTGIESLAKIMIDHNIHRLIIEKDNAIIGIISTLDILYHVAGLEKNG